MLRQAITIGFVLLLGASALFGYTFYNQRRQQRLEQEKLDKCGVDLSRLNEIVGDKIDTRHFKDIVYDESPQQRLQARAELEEKRGLILTLSGVLALSGGSVLGLSLVMGTARLVAKGFGCLLNVGHAAKRAGSNEAETEEAPGDNTHLRQQQKTAGGEDSVEKTAPFARHDIARSKNNQETMVKSKKSKNKTAKDKGSHESGPAASKGNLSAQKNQGADNKADNRKAGDGGPFARKLSAEPEAERAVSQLKDTAVLLCDEESFKLEQPTKITEEIIASENTAVDSASSQEKSSRLEDSFKKRTEELEKRMAEFKKMADRQSRLEQSNHPLQDSIKELREQMTAIREYAAHQQERVSKLQDGYDWTIIKNFCLRIIRCVDNIEMRISAQGPEDAFTTNLEEIRDELVFALESTGVEQFEPEINSDYRGQEKNAEVVKEKLPCSEPELAGKIAQVVRCGYQYFIDEENSRIVRPAQVKLYEQVELV